MKTFTLEPIGFVRSSYTSKYDAPRQPAVDDRSEPAVIELLPHKNFEQALEDLEGVERIWVIALFDQALNWKPKVLTPRDRTKRGVFATRSPHRPNPISISAVNLLSVKGLTLHVETLDLLDGTPILDIKPYVPYADSFPSSKAGWLDELVEKQYNVNIPSSLEELDRSELLAYARRVLTTDPWPHPYRRTKQVDDNAYELAYKAWRVYYSIDKDVVNVTSIVLQDS